MRKLRKIVCGITSLIFLIFASSNSLIYSQVLAFPGADGFGKYTTGGRGGIVIEVTNLNDIGAGSLRNAIATASPRTIVFKVSGTIALQSDLKITIGDLTIAGQTAPGEGICIKGFSTVVQANNVIIRYIRFRPGDELHLTGVTVFENDALTGKEHSNIIIDHCSMSWAIDEVSSFYDNTNFTMQWCIISESLFRSYHSKGDHGYGGIWGGMNATFHHNLLADHPSRNPRFCGARYHIATSNLEIVDYRNNVIFNWGFNSAYGGEGGHQNMVNNYYKSGPATGGSVMGRIVNPSYSADPLVDTLSYWYITGNYVEGFPTTTADNWNGGFQPDGAALWRKVVTPFPFVIDSTETAVNAFNSVIANCGANLPRRDTLDERILNETQTGNPFYGSAYGAKTGIIDSQVDVGGYPELLGAYPLLDSDHDGMPDDWELAHGLNPSDSSDGKTNLHGDGYSALEVYIDSITVMKEFLEPPSQFKVKLTDYKKIKLSWKDNSSKETGFVIERKDSTADYKIIDTAAANSISFIDTILLYNTTYTYRIKAISSTDSSIYTIELPITTLAITSLSLKANIISPVNSSTSQSISPIIKWEAGVGANSHDVYFGATNPPVSKGNTSTTSYNPGLLSHNTKYYCRIDEVNDYGTTTGTVSGFTTKKAIQQTLVGSWNFETVMQANDKSGWRNNGTLNNFTAENYKDTGAINKYIFFNGINQYIRVPNSTVLNFDINSFSISFWIKQDSMSVDRSKKYFYLIKGSNTLNESLNRSGKNYQVYYDPQNSKIGFSISDGNLKSEVTSNASSFVTNQWVMLTALRDTDTHTLRLYVNYQQLAEAPDITEDLSASEDLYFGHSPEDSSYLSGGLDEIHMYSYPLSDWEIDSLFSLRVINEVKHINNYPTCTVYPNPASNMLTVNINLTKPVKVSVSLQNIQGQTIRLFKQNQVLNQGYNQEVINLNANENNIPNGLYFLTVTVDKNIQRNKILIIK